MTGPESFGDLANPEATTPPGPKRANRPWFRQSRVILIVVLLLAFELGSISVAAVSRSKESTSRAEISQLQADIGDTDADLSSATSDLATTRTDLAEARTEAADTIAGMQDDFAAQQAALDQRSADLDVRSQGLDAREAAIAAAEAAALANQFAGDGVFLVGVDITAGQYRNDGTGSGCYWARLSGTGGAFDDIIANGYVNGPTVVTISANDVAFETSGCGTWSKIT